MGSFKSFGKKGFGGGSRGFGGKPSFGAKGAGGKPFMHSATCAECGNQCQVPFKPSAGKRVLCSNCFAAQGGSSQRPSGRNFTPTSDFSNNKPKFQAACSKCGKNCEVPFRPMEGKKVFCAECFDKGINAGVKNAGQFNDQLIALNTKLDKILALLSQGEVQKAITKELEEVVEHVEPKKASKAKAKAAPKKVAKKKK